MPLIHRSHWFAACLASLLIIPVASNQAAAAEMTAQSLLKAYVEEVGEKHLDVTAALTVFKTGDFDLARDMLEKATVADPALPPAGILLTRMFIAAGQPALARAELETVTEKHPNDPEAFLGMGELAVAEKRLADAELSFRKSTELAKAKKLSEYRQLKMVQRVRLGLASIAEQREDWAAAVKLLQPIVDEDITQGELVARLARGRFKNGESDVAFALLTKHYETDTENTRRPEITMGLLFQEDGDKEKAAQSIKLAAGKDPNSVATQSFVATWALERGDLELAQACADRNLVASKSSIPARLLVALVARYKKEYTVAREMLESVHLESPANLGAVIELAIVLGHIDEMENRSLEYAQVGIKLQPNLKLPAGRSAAMALAWVLNKYGGQAEAEKIVAQVLAAGPIGVESSYFAAKILSGGKNTAAAKKLLEQVIASDRAFPGSLDAKILYETMK